MRVSTFFAMTALSLVGAYFGYRLIENYIHETVIYPPEVLAQPYLTFELPARDYSSGDWFMGEGVTIRFDYERPIIYVEHEDRKVTQAYDYSLHLISTAKTLDVQGQLAHPTDSNTKYIVPGRYGFGHNVKDEAWRYGGEIRDLPGNRTLLTPYGNNWIGNRDVVNFTPNPTIGMKDWSIRFDGKWRNEMGAYATGDNLFGLTEKHRLPLSFFTGSWTLTVLGKPILRQRVKNLPIGADFYYSPVYGLVLFSYQGPKNKCTLYMIKTPASGPEVYRDLKEATTVIGTRPSH